MTRGRWAAVAAVVVLAVAAVTAAIVRDRPAPGPPPAIVSGRLPDADEAPRLPLKPTPLPERLSIPAQPVALSAKPLRRALALLAVDATVWVVGDDQTLRLFDTVKLAPVADKDGNAHSPASSTTLSPDGRYAAFPQPDRVIVVDLAEQRFSEMRVPGPNEWAGWLGDTVVVTQAASTSLAKPADGRVTKAPFKGLDVAFDHGMAPDVYEVTGGSSLNRWAGDTSQTVELQGVTLDQVQNPLWRNGNRLAVLDGGLGASRRLSVLVVDGTRATVSHRLVLAPKPPKTVADDATVLGWLTEHSLLIRSGGWILAWDPADDAITRVSAVDGAPVISLPDLL